MTINKSDWRAAQGFIVLHTNVPAIVAKYGSENIMVAVGGWDYIRRRSGCPSHRELFLHRAVEARHPQNDGVITIKMTARNWVAALRSTGTRVGVGDTRSVALLDAWEKLDRTADSKTNAAAMMGMAVASGLTPTFYIPNKVGAVAVPYEENI